MRKGNISKDYEEIKKGDKLQVASMDSMTESSEDIKLFLKRKVEATSVSQYGVKVKLPKNKKGESTKEIILSGHCLRKI